MSTRPYISLALVLQLALAASARADIVGGEEVSETDAARASTIGLYTPSPDGHGGALCTASIIDKDMAVTAAHCIAPGGPKPVVLFGRDLHSRQTVARPVLGARVNPGWGRSHGQGMDQGDIAVVRFPNGLPPGYRPIGVASEKALRKGTPAELAGFGVSNARTHAGAGRLRRTQVSIADPRTGRPEMVLDQSHGHGACHGDSGGPALVRYRGRSVLAGVTNRSYPDTAPDDCGHQVIYTKVGAYRNWIKKTEGELRTSPQLATRARRRPRALAAHRPPAARARTSAAPAGRHRHRR